MAINNCLAKSHYWQDGCVCYDSDGLKQIRALTGEKALAALLLGYEHFLWLVGHTARRTRGPGGRDFVIYAMGLDFAIQTLARIRDLPFTSDSLGRFTTAYLTRENPITLLPPQIIVGLIVREAGRLGRANELGAPCIGLLRNVTVVLRDWDRDRYGAVPRILLKRLENTLSNHP